MCAALRKIRSHIRHASKFDKAAALLRKLLDDGSLSEHFRRQTFQARTSPPRGGPSAAAAAAALQSDALPQPGVCCSVHLPLGPLS